MTTVTRRVGILAAAAVLFASAALAASSELLEALRGGDHRSVARLVATGADVNAADENGATPLMYAAAFSTLADLRLLADHQANVNAANANGSTALMWAAGDTAKIRLLLAHGASVDARTKDGTTALIVAARHRNLDGMRALMARGADAAVRTTSGGDLQGALASRDDGDLQQVMGQLGLTLHLPTGPQASPVTDSVRSRPLLERLLALGGNAAEESISGTVTLPAITIAAYTGQVDVAKLLLDHGASANAASSRRATPLMFAVGAPNPNPAMVRLLIDRGADLAARDDLNRTALDWALLQGETAAAAALRAAGAPAGAGVAPPAIPLLAAPLPPRDAVAKAVARLQPIGPSFNARTKCISCHNESLPAIAVALARARGITVDERLALHPREATLAMWKPVVEELMLGRHAVPGFTANVSYALASFVDEAVERTWVTDAAAIALAGAQRPDGSWFLDDLRPPIGDGSALPFTAFAVRGLTRYMPPGRGDDLKAITARARAYLRQAVTASTQDEAFKLLGLVWAGAGARDTARQAARLTALQRPDGGWAQLPSMDPDAFATGQALYALNAAGTPTTSPAYTKGAEFLLRSQREDGSWHVRSRAFGFQAYFESGFPYGRDQFISAAATSYAAIALAYTLETRKSGVGSR
jgi:ankyrin repeat protein